MNCEFCQSPVHVWFQCPRKPDGWKPARLAKVRISTPSPDRPVTPKSDVSASPPFDSKVHTQSTAARSNARVMAECTCELCGKPFKAVPHEVKRGKARTCSKACAAKLASRPDQSGENNPNWKGGVPKTEKNRRYVVRYPEKHEAHRLMTNAIRRGDLIRKPCEVCGDPKVDGHHDDYSKPLDVRWLCRVHHLEVHKGRFGVAGTQALPVEGSVSPALAGKKRQYRGLDTAGRKPVVRTVASDTDPIKFDKKAWMREYMREHRRGLRRRGTSH